MLVADDSPLQSGDEAMDDRRRDIQQLLDERDRAAEAAKLAVVTSEALLARVREVAQAVDERIHDVLKSQDCCA
jgi:F0F1-type ATP synthase membrane subunit b/b'